MFEIVVTIKIIRKLNKKTRNTNFLIAIRISDQRDETFSTQTPLTKIFRSANDENDQLLSHWLELNIRLQRNIYAMVTMFKCICELRKYQFILQIDNSLGTKKFQ